MPEAQTILNGLMVLCSVIGCIIYICALRKQGNSVGAACLSIVLNGMLLGIYGAFHHDGASRAPSPTDIRYIEIGLMMVLAGAVLGIAREAHASRRRMAASQMMSPSIITTQPTSGSAAHQTTVQLMEAVQLAATSPTSATARTTGKPREKLVQGRRG